MHEAESLDYDDLWRRVLAGTQWQMRVGRRLMRHLPADPRCKLCAAPFGGIGGPLMRLAGKRPWPRNPKFCSQCFRQLTDHHGGAEIGCSLMFADVRGSTTMAEGMRPSKVHELMERFFDTGARVLVDHDAIVDRFVGDQAIGIFVPALTGADHARRAIEAARALVGATGGGEDGPGSRSGPACTPESLSSGPSAAGHMSTSPRWAIRSTSRRDWRRRRTPARSS